MKVVSDPARRAALVKRYRRARALHAIAGLLPGRARDWLRAGAFG